MAHGGSNGPTLVRFPLNNAAELDGNVTAGQGHKAWYDFWGSDYGTYPAPTVLATNNQIGTVYGQAWDQTAGAIYVSAYTKRKTKFGPNGTGAIYKIANANGTPSTPALFVDLNAIFGANTAGSDPHPSATTNWFDDGATKQHVGKIALGDLDISKDFKYLYTVNLVDRTLYIIPTSGALNSTTIKRIQIPTSVPGMCDHLVLV
jgi:hypothetical protein